MSDNWVDGAYEAGSDESGEPPASGGQDEATTSAGPDETDEVNPSEEDSSRDTLPDDDGVGMGLSEKSSFEPEEDPDAVDPAD